MYDHFRSKSELLTTDAEDFLPFTDQEGPNVRRINGHNSYISWNWRRVRGSDTNEIYATGIIQNFAILEAFIAQAYKLPQFEAYFLCYIYQDENKCFLVRKGSFSIRKR